MKQAIYLLVLMPGLWLLSLGTFLFVAARPGQAAANLSPITPACDTAELARLESDFRRIVTIRVAQPEIFSEVEYRSAALNYIARAERCYHAAVSPAGQTATEPILIDEGGLWVSGFGPAAAGEIGGQYLLHGTKWVPGGSGIEINLGDPPTPGGIVTYSFIADGVSHVVEGNNLGANRDIRRLNIQNCPGPDIEQEIATAFAAWSAVADIQFMKIEETGRVASNAPAGNDRIGDIRIGTHSFSNIKPIRLAHAYFPPPNGVSLSGDIHFNGEVTWSCNGAAGTFDLGLVALHEIGHAIGLEHELDQVTVAIMNKNYNAQLTLLQPDDREGVTAIYGQTPLFFLTGDNLCDSPFFEVARYDHENEAGWQANPGRGYREWVWESGGRDDSSHWFASAEVVSSPEKLNTVTYLESEPISPGQTDRYIVSFLHKHYFPYNTADFYEGGVVEISSTTTLAWTDIGPDSFIKNGYNGKIAGSFGNPLAGGVAFVGNSGGDGDYIQSVIKLDSFVNRGDTFRLRFGLAADEYKFGFNNPSPVGWHIDDVLICGTKQFYFPLIFKRD